MSRGGRIDPMRFPDGALGCDERIDIATAESFPASDPPSWNSGLVMRSEWQVRDIVVATDLSDCSRNVVGLAVDLASAAGARLTVVHARETAPRYTDRYRFVSPQTGAPPRYADLYADAFERPGEPPDVERPVDQEAVTALVRTHHDQLATVARVRQVAIAGEPVRTILDAANAAGAALIVMGSHGRNAVAGALLGSTTDAVLRRSGLPVLSVPCALPQRKDGVVIAVLDDAASAEHVQHRGAEIAAILAAELVTIRVPNDGLVRDRPELAAARLIVIAFPRDEKREVSRRDPNVRVLLRSGVIPVLTIPVAP